MNLKIVDCNNTKLKQVEVFKYLGVTISQEGGSEEAVRARINPAWSKWKNFIRIIYDRRMPRKLKVKIYETLIRGVMLYGAEVWTVRRKEERMLEKTEMKMLRRVMGLTLRDRK